MCNVLLWEHHLHETSSNEMEENGFYCEYVQTTSTPWMLIPIM